MYESLSLDKKEINAQNNVTVVFVHVRGTGTKSKQGTRAASPVRVVFPLSVVATSIWPVDDGGPLSVSCGDRAVHKKMRGKELKKLGFAGAAQKAVELARTVCLGHVAWSEHFFVPERSTKWCKRQRGRHHRWTKG